MTLAESFNAFLDWSEERGLPLRSFANALEEKGVPPLAFFTFIAVLLLAGVAFLVFPAIVPQTTTVTVKLQALDGTPLPGVPVYLTPAEVGKFASVERVTDAQGQAVFEGIPRTRVLVTSAVPGGAFQDDQQDVVLSRAQESVVLTAVPLQDTRVSLAVNVKGAPDARVLLFDSAGAQLDAQAGLNPVFRVAPNAAYDVRVEADGFAAERKAVTVGATDALPVVIRLVETGKQKTGALFVGVFDSPALAANGIAGATVTVADAFTGETLYTLLTGPDGTAREEAIPLGTSLRVTASADGFLPAFADATVEEETNVRLNFARLPADAALAIKVQVIDETGRAVASPLVRVYAAGAKVAEKIPLDGVTSFDQPPGAALLLTASRAGFLPVQKRLTAASARDLHTLVLRRADANNAAPLAVAVTDYKGLPVIGASVGLATAQGDALGVAERKTGIDGRALFDGVPLGPVGVVASRGPASVQGTATVTVDGTPDENATLLSLSFPPLQGRVSLEFRDAFSNRTLENGQANASNALGKAECAVSSRSKGRCALLIEEGESTATVTAPGYEAQVISFASNPAKETLVPVFLTPAGVQQNIQLQFLGIFDLNGRRASTLAPSTDYVAKYVLRNPGVEFSRARAHVRLGTPDGEDDVAEITGYAAPGAALQPGRDYEEARANPPAPAQAAPFAERGATATPTPVLPLNFSAPSPASTPSAPAAGAPASAGTPAGLFFATPTELQGRETRGYKWVDFEFPAFADARELRVQFRTKPVAQGTVSLFHHTAFTTALGVLRSPEDARAGVAYHELLAASQKTTDAQLSFQGDCVGNACVSLFFDGRSGRSLKNFAAELGETFSLRFRAVLDGTARVTLRSASPAVSLQSASAGEGAAAVLGTPVRDAEGESASLDVRASNHPVDGAFSLRALLNSNAVPLSLTVESTDGESFEKQLFLRVAGPATLRVDVRPSRLQALQENPVTFTVVDGTTGAPVDFARVTLGSDFDALEGRTLDAVNVNDDGRMGVSRSTDAGVYRAAVTPERLGVVDWRVQATGYRDRTGSLDVVATDLVSVEPDALSLSTERREGGTATFTVTNHLRDDARVSISLSNNVPPRYSLVSVDNPSFTLKGGETRTVTLSARAREDLLTLASGNAGQTLREDLSGLVRVTARVGLESDDEEIPFNVRASFAQEPLGEAWDVSSDAFEVELTPPRDLTKSERIRVTNAAPFPLVINHQLAASRVRVTPLSAVVAPGDTAEFTVTASARGDFAREGCFFEGLTEQGELAFFASFQGLRSAKTVKLTVVTNPGGNCAPRDGVPISLPTDAYFSVTPGTLVKNNDDGSVAVQFPNGERALFQFGRFYANELSVPAGATMVLPRALVGFKDLAGFSAEVRLPLAARLALPVGAQFPQFAAQPTSVNYEVYKLTFPVGTQSVQFAVPDQYRVLGLPPGQAQQFLYNNQRVLLREPTRAVQLPPLAPLLIQPLSEEERAGLQGTVVRSFPGFPDDVTFEIQRPHVYGQELASVILERCEPVKVYGRDNRLLMVLPAAHRIAFQTGAVQLPPQRPGEARPPTPLRIRARAGTTYTLNLCLEQTRLRFAMCPAQASTFYFTDAKGVSPTSGEVRFAECKNPQLRFREASGQLPDWPIGVQAAYFPRPGTDTQFSATEDELGRVTYTSATVVGSQRAGRDTCIEFEVCDDFAQGSLNTGGPIAADANLLRLVTARNELIRTAQQLYSFVDHYETPEGTAAVTLATDEDFKKLGLYAELRGNQVTQDLTLHFRADGSARLLNAGPDLNSVSFLGATTPAGLNARPTDFVSTNPAFTRWDAAGRTLQRDSIEPFIQRRQLVPFKLRIQAPESLLDADRCVGADATLKLQLPFSATAAGATTPMRPVLVPVLVRLVKTDACATKGTTHFGRVATDLDAATLGADFTTETELVFKETGTSRPFFITNNRFHPVRVTVTRQTPLAVCGVQTPQGPTALNGYRLAPSASVAVHCTAVAHGGPQDFELTFSDDAPGVSGLPAKRVISVTVHRSAAAAAFYREAGTPWGARLPDGQAGTSLACNRYYCDFDQFNSALADYFDTLYQAYVQPYSVAAGDAQALAKRNDDLDALCARVQQGTGKSELEQSWVLKKTASFGRDDIDANNARAFLNNRAAEIRRTLQQTHRVAQFTLDTAQGDVPRLQECGAFELRTRVEFYCGDPTIRHNPADWHERLAFTTTVNKIADCAPQLSNAPLLLEKVEPTDAQPELVSPRLVAGVVPTSLSPSTVVSQLGQFASALGRAEFFDEPAFWIGEYTNQVHATDRATVQALYQSLYGTTTAPEPIPASRYYAARFCTVEGAAAVGKFAAVLAGAATASVFFPAIAPYVAKVSYNVGIATPICIADVVGRQVGAVGRGTFDSAVCRGINDCLNTVILTAALPIPGRAVTRLNPQAAGALVGRGASNVVSGIKNPASLNGVLLYGSLGASALSEALTAPHPHSAWKERLIPAAITATRLVPVAKRAIGSRALPRSQVIAGTRGVFPAAVMSAFLGLLFRADVTPVEVFLDRAEPAYLAAYHETLNPLNPVPKLTAIRLCEEGDAGDCAQEVSFDDACPADAAACIGLFQKTTQFRSATLQSPSVVVVTLRQLSAKPADFFDSIFDPAAAPVAFRQGQRPAFFTGSLKAQSSSPATAAPASSEAPERGEPS